MVKALKVHIRYIPIEELERVLKYGWSFITITAFNLIYMHVGLPKRYTAQGGKIMKYN